MNTTHVSQITDKDELSALWPESYSDWVEDWTDAYNAGASMVCCPPGPWLETIIWPIDQF